MLILNVATQPIRTEYAIQKSVLNLQTTIPKIEISTEAATLDIRQSLGQLEIDATPCRYARGIKNLADFSRDNAQAGRDAAMEAIGRTAEEGNRLARIESGENAIANMAADTNTVPIPEVVLAHVPLPDISYTPNTPKIEVIDGKLDINFERGTVQGDFQPGAVNINVAQYPSIKMWTTENKVDTMV
ncbi:MAG: hypothetical protein H7X79_06835 [Sporomusaceae bacterium]|nr:hypothetical protein [Sporomusaceae bacterium]